MELEMLKLVQGVYAAVLTPRSEDGSLDRSALRATFRFLREHGIRGYALNGATGEYPLTSAAQLSEIVQIAREVCGEEAGLLCCVGGAGLQQTMDLVRVAEAERVRGLLLPMPYFFPYAQHDLDSFCRTVAAQTHLPVLLYNLPQFTSGLEVDTVCALVEHVENIVGIKDSSGSLEILRALRERAPSSCRIVGNDSALAKAREEGLCDGVVSGVACVLPDLISALFAADPAGAEFRETREALDACIDQLNGIPTPWGLKWIAQALGIAQARFAQPLSDIRRQQGEALQQWFHEWSQTRASAAERG